MSKKERILWIDNDTGYPFPYETVLVLNGYEVEIVPTVTEGEAAIEAGGVALVILDVMIPVTEAEETGNYTPEETDDTYKTGLVFFVKNRERLKKNNILVMAMTVRIDQRIADEFAEAGLPSQCFVRKFDVRTADAFLDKVQSILAMRTKEGQ